MKNFTKLMAVVMCIIIALSSAACSLTPQWSYKTGDTELNIGVYIYALYNAYTQAETLAQETEGYDAEKGTYNGETSFLNVEITDEDGKKATADQWIQDEADEMLRSLLAVETEFERLGATLDEATVEGIKTSAKESWEYGPYYAMYGEQYKNPYKDIFEPLGVSYESFEYFYISSAKQQEVFERLYGEGGEKEVSTDDLTVYFKSNYTSYTYFNTNLYETVESTADSADAAQSLSKALPKKTINEYEDLYKGYAKAVNQGTDIKTVTETFVKDFKLESDPSTSNVEILENSSIGEDLVDAIDILEEGQAECKIIGEENSQVLYFFYKEPIKNQVKNYISDEANRSSVLQNMKGTEYSDYITELSKNIDITVSKAVSKYTPEMFED